MLARTKAGLARWWGLAALACVLSIVTGVTRAQPLKVVYSDWPGWTPFEIGIQKGWFKEAGVEVEFLWMDYVAGMEAYAAGQLDAMTVTNGDALVTGSTGKPSVCILINDFSNGNDMLVAKPGIESPADLKGKKIGAEIGFVSHLLALTAIESAGLKAEDVEWVNVPNGETPQVLASGAVDAIAAWQPSSGQALKLVDGAKAVFTSANAPGIIYDCVFVSPQSLKERREDWVKFIGVWYRIVDYMQDPSNKDEVLAILAGRVGVTPEEYEPFLDGTYILNFDEAMTVWEKGEGLDSIYGSSMYVDTFNVAQGIYDKPMDVESYLDPSLMKEAAALRGQ